MSDAPVTAAPKINKFAKAAKAPEDAVAKALKVKTGTVTRNIKDLTFAKNEVLREEARLEKVRAEDPDKEQQQLNVIQEAKTMIPLAENRIRSALQDLKEYLATETGFSEVHEEAKVAAQKAVEEAEVLFPAQ